MKEHLTLHRLRAIFAIVIALSLTLAPITSALAAMQMRASTDAAAAAVTAVADEAMSDCMKAMQAKGQTEGQAQDQNCPCCDTPLKSMCPDVDACLAKCSVLVIAVLTPSAHNRVPTIRHNWPADPQEPPDWAFAPPAPPPRA